VIPRPVMMWLRGPAAPRFTVHFLLLCRAVMAALVPLTADEAYYWLWSKHLDAGYLDHPPAIAWLIRLGTLLFGDTPIGVRIAGVLLSGLATMFVWESARTLLKSEARAFTAALLFNLTLMVTALMLAATPDMPSLVTSAGLLFCLVRLQDSGNAKWWLWAGLAAGLSLLSKYSALFEIAGVFLWLIISPRQRPGADAPKKKMWLTTPWPWAGAILALLIFAPNLYWQTSHNWETFIFQGNRVVGHQLTGRFLLEFLGAQLGLASPFIFILGVVGLARARPQSDLFLPAMLVWPGLIYFLIHALHDRVQGNWPCFLYPAFVILAVSEFAETGWRKWCARAAAPVAAIFLLVAYGQALTGFLPLGGRDPLARLLGVGFKPVADSLASAARAQGIGAVLTTDYETTAWLRFYEPGLKVVQVEEPYRYPAAPIPDAALMRGPLLYFVEQKRDRNADLQKYFSSVSLATGLRIGKAGQTLALYEIYAVQTPKGPVPGRMP
jgi:4-amino-4-deoxy-L-arabinose transferase-like glycosyltransferase